MDQTKIGSFIAERRKTKNMTQRELAETLNISDKTVSKWETGKGLPEVSLMLPLCECLGITVNELLSGESLSAADYQKKAEETIVNLMKEREESKKKIVLCIVVLFLTLLASLTILAIVEFWTMGKGTRILLTVIGFVILFGGLGVAASLEMSAGTYECRHCKHRFVPTAGAYIPGPHSITTRYLKCPNCGQKSFCKRRLTH